MRYPSPALPCLALTLILGARVCTNLHLLALSLISASLPLYSSKPFTQTAALQHNPVQSTETGFDITQFYTTLHNLTQLYPTLPNFTQLYLTLPNFTQLYTTLHNFTKHFSTLYNFTQLYPTLPKFTQLYLTLPNFTQLYHIFTKLYPTLLNFTITLGSAQYSTSEKFHSRKPIKTEVFLQA